MKYITKTKIESMIFNLSLVDTCNILCCEEEDGEVILWFEDIDESIRIENMLCKHKETFKFFTENEYIPSGHSFQGCWKIFGEMHFLYKV